MASVPPGLSLRLPITWHRRRAVISGSGLAKARPQAAVFKTGQVTVLTCADFGTTGNFGAYST